MHVYGTRIIEHARLLPMNCTQIQIIILTNVLILFEILIFMMVIKQLKMKKVIVCCAHIMVVVQYCLVVYAKYSILITFGVIFYI